MGEDYFVLATNVRETLDNAIQTRPGLASLFATAGTAITDLRAYTQLGADDAPRFLARDANGRIYLDTGAPAGFGILGVSPDGKLGVSMIPFRPAQSPNPYMYVASGAAYDKFSAPDAANVVTQQAVGIAEPQSPPSAAAVSQFQSFIGPPSAGGFTPGGNTTGLGAGSRLADTVQGVFVDPASGGSRASLAVAGTSTLPAGLYFNDAVIIYVWPSNHAFAGAFALPYPTSTGTATGSAVGNSLQFNPPQFGAGEDPNVQPMKWAVIDDNGAYTGVYNNVPTSGGSTGFQNWYMSALTSIYVPVAGTYTIQIDHDDGMIFAIQGATLVSGSFSDGFTPPHTQTAVAGYSFNGGGVAGINQSGHVNETFVVSFPTPGVYPLEINYCQWENEQTLNFLFNGAPMPFASGLQTYQRDMAVLIHGQLFTLDDVYAPLPSGLNVQGIYYFAGATGRCVVVPGGLGSGPGTDGESINSAIYLSALRRGALVQIGAEVCFVLSTSRGPDGTISFETSTTATHTAGEPLSGVQAIAIVGAGFTVGDAITSPDVEFAVTTGIGTITATLGLNPFVTGLFSFQDEDYLHFSVNVDNLANLGELKLLIDVGDGSFQSNYYFYTVRPSDIAAGLTNTLTQLGVAQLVSQRAVIDEEKAALAANQGVTYSSAQTSPGNGQWSEIRFQISELTRVGNDQSLSLQNAKSVQLLVNATGTLAMRFNSLTVTGGFTPDVGDAGAPYLYRVRPRSRVTGAKGNPSPATRYGCNPRRQQVRVTLPSAAYDPQIDTWDVFRYGGTITSWRFIGSAPSASVNFQDNYGDDAATAGDALEFDNYEPWPSVDLPLVAAGSVVGTTALVTVTPPTNVTRYLPGNRVQIGSVNVYTLQTRPTQVGANTYLFQLIENARVLPAGTSISIYEPDLARQFLPYMWGPDADGTIFAVGDPLRLGSFSFCKGNAPDSAPDKYSQELVPPSEPLLGGDIANGLSYVASPERWWALYPQHGNDLQRYNAVPQPIPRGLVSPFGHCSDGTAIYFWAKDGIWSTKAGSLTDADLHNLFPHEGVPGVDVTYQGRTVHAPDYSRAGTFRLSKVNDYLYAIYQDSAGLYRNLTLNTRTGAWRVDAYATAVSAVYHPEQQAGSLFSGSGSPPTPTLYPASVMGNISGVVARQAQGSNDLGTPISGVLATGEWDGGDLRASQQWGDVMLDVAPLGGMTVTPMSGGAPVSVPPTVIVAGARNPEQPRLITLAGGSLQRFLGLLATWTDDYTTQSGPTTLYAWQPSYILKQETTQDRFSDWLPVQADSSSGYVQGVLLRADTFNQVKSIKFRDSDTLTLHTMTPAVQHNGESTLPYSFDVPFDAHLIRLEPQDAVPWRLFAIHPVAEATPEAAETWQTQGTSHGRLGYMHLKQLSVAYSASEDITLTITSYDGQSPAPLTIPANGDALQKRTFILTANKGMLYFYKAVSGAPFQLYLPDWEIMIGEWGRTSAYLRYQNLGGEKGDQARI